MRQKLFILIALLSVSLYTNAQEYRVAKSSGTLKLNITGVVVEGYDGKDIVFSGDKMVVEETSDERAKGLVPISTSKHVDNTGLGISVTENGQDVNVNLVSKKPIGVLTIKVPNNIKISIVSNGLFYSYSTNLNSSVHFTAVSDNNDIIIKNIKSEIEVSVQSSKIRLENNSGPMNIKSVSGPIEAIFSGEVKGPVSIISVNNYVDITLPASTKANIEMSSNYGKLFAGKEFKIDLDKEEERSVYNLRTSGERYGDVIPGAITIKGDQATSVSGVKVNAKGKATGTTKTNTEEVVVTGYGTNTAASKKNVKDTISSIIVNGIQINGNGNISSTNSINGQLAPVNGRTFTSIGYAFRSGDRIKGKLNGGGVDLIFKSTNKNVYLRQQ